MDQGSYCAGLHAELVVVRSLRRVCAELLLTNIGAAGRFVIAGNSPPPGFDKLQAEKKPNRRVPDRTRMDVHFRHNMLHHEAPKKHHEYLVQKHASRYSPVVDTRLAYWCTVYLVERPVVYV